MVVCALLSRRRSIVAVIASTHHPFYYRASTSTGEDSSPDYFWDSEARITPQGWVQEENNIKLVQQSGKYLAREYGVARYERIRDADLILAVGARLGEATTDGYTLITPDHPGQTLVHVHPDPNELGRVYHADLPICADMGEFAEMVDEWIDPDLVRFSCGEEAPSSRLKCDRAPSSAKPVKTTGKPFWVIVS